MNGKITITKYKSITGEPIDGNELVRKQKISLAGQIILNFTENFLTIVHENRE